MELKGFNSQLLWKGVVTLNSYKVRGRLLVSILNSYGRELSLRALVAAFLLLMFQFSTPMEGSCHGGEPSPPFRRDCGRRSREPSSVPRLESLASGHKSVKSRSWRGSRGDPVEQTTKSPSGGHSGRLAVAATPDTPSLAHEPRLVGTPLRRPEPSAPEVRHRRHQTPVASPGCAQPASSQTAGGQVHYRTCSDA